MRTARKAEKSSRSTEYRGRGRNLSKKVVSAGSSSGGEGLRKRGTGNPRMSRYVANSMEKRVARVLALSDGPPQR